MKALVGTFNKEKALVGAFSVIVHHRRSIVYSSTSHNLPSLAIVRNGGRARQDMQITAHKVYIIVMISLSQTRASSCNVTSVNTVNSGQPASSVMQVISARTE